jgi:hypothetical protein
VNHNKTPKSNCKETAPKQTTSCKNQYSDQSVYITISMACEFFTGDWIGSDKRVHVNKAIRHSGEGRNPEEFSIASSG